MRVKALATIDVSLAYTIRPELSIFLDVVNLEDKWPVTFSGADSKRVRIVDSYGTRLNIGINGRF
jgi:outer membrane receptor protein involved in Fe transport